MKTKREKKFWSLPNFLWLACVAATAALVVWQFPTNIPVFGGGEDKIEIVGDLVVIRVTGMTDKSWAMRVEEAGKDESTEAVLLWIESPGGYVSDARLFAHDLDLVRAEIDKPIYIYTEYMLASGAYWVACTMDSIFASPAAYVGGIGIFSVRVDVTKADSINGVKYWFFYGGEHKLWGHPNAAITDEEKEHRAFRIRDIYEEFIVRVLTGRKEAFLERAAMLGMDPPGMIKMLGYTTAVANGEVYRAKDAQEIGLVDRVAYFSDLCDDFRDQGFEIKRENGDTIENFYQEK